MQEVIDKIRAAEKEAEALKAKARKEAEDAVVQAEIRGKKQKEDAAAQAVRKADKLMKQAQEKAAAEGETRIRTARREADEILKIAESRMDYAALKIVEGIVDHI